MKDDELIVGRCPICQNKLELGEDGQLYCGDHYRITVGIYNKAWEVFGQATQNYKMEFVDWPVDALMKVLLDNNTALREDKDESQKE